MLVHQEVLATATHKPVNVIWVFNLTIASGAVGTSADLILLRTTVNSSIGFFIFFLSTFSAFWANPILARSRFASTAPCVQDRIIAKINKIAHKF